MRCVVCFVVFYASALPALAGIIVQNSIQLCNVSPACPFVVSPQSTAIDYPSTVITNSTPNGDKSITISGTANADPNSLVLRASGTYTTPSPEAFYDELSFNALLGDTFIISDPSLNGTVGSLEMLFDFTGTTTGTGFGGLTVILDDSAGGSTGACDQDVSACLFTGDTNLLAGAGDTGTLSFHYGSPFTLGWGLSAIMFPNQGTSGSADYSETGTLEGIYLLDSNQNPVYDATITGTGGEQIQVLTPEPGMAIPVVLCFVSMGLVKGLRYRRSALRSQR